MRITQKGLSLRKSIGVFFVLLAAAINTARAARFARSESRIVDGVNVTPQNKYPMLVAIFKEGVQKCVGSILNKYYVMTNGGCVKFVDRQKEIYRIVAGIYNLGEPDPRYVQNISVKSVTNHARYDGPTKGVAANNIGVIKLSRPLIWNDHVAPTNLPVPGWTVLPNKEMKAISVGWGVGRNLTYPYAPSRPLQEVELPLLTTEGCQREWYSYQITDYIVCTEAVGGAGACYGDNSSPLFIYNETNEKHVQIGIFAFLHDLCGSTSSVMATGYTKVSMFNHWIDEAIRECNPIRPV